MFFFVVLASIYIVERQKKMLKQYAYNTPDVNKH